MATFAFEQMENRDAMTAGLFSSTIPDPVQTREHILLARQVGVPAVTPNIPSVLNLFSPDGKDPAFLTVKMMDSLVTG